MSDFYEEEISKITEWNEELVAENKELEKKNAELVKALKDIYNDAENYDGEYYDSYFKRISEKAEQALKENNGQ